MSYRKSVSWCLAAAMLLNCSAAYASDENLAVYDRAFFDQFAPQNALEMIERLPGFSLLEADEARGLSQGGTNVLVNGQPITGKGETATTQIAQITANSVVRIEILDAGAIDIPGFSGLVANIITRQTSISGSILWEPSFRSRDNTAPANGNVSVSGSTGNLDYSAAFDSTSVRIAYDGPETLSAADGTVFETREEVFSIRGYQPNLSGSISWKRPDGHILNAKASFDQLDMKRGQTSVATAILPRGANGSSIVAVSSKQDTLRFDTDYAMPAFGGSIKLIGLARLQNNDAETRLTIDDAAGNRLAGQGFDEDSSAFEGVVRVEQQWNGADNQSWQLAGEGAFNSLDLRTDFLTFGTVDPATVTARTTSETTIEELRGELTLAHRRRLSGRSDLQVSVGGEISQITQGAFERRFFRPKGFVAYTLRPEDGWTLSARIAREVGQINFRDFAASVSLFDQATTDNNPELVPQQSWVFSGRAERRFGAGHVASLDVEHELISDLVDRIPLGATGDAVGNIPSATRTRVAASITVLGAPIGLSGAQLDLSGSWQWSSVTDPIQGFERDIGNLRLHDLEIRFRHDLPGTDWSYGFAFQELKLAPIYRSTFVQYRNVPGGGLTPGTNEIFVEHKNLLGLRARLELSEFLGQKSRFRRTIHAGRRDLAPVDRIEARERALLGPVVTLSLAKSF